MTTAILAALTPSALGLGLGALLALGSVLILTGVPRWRRPSLTDRLSPYLRAVPRSSRLLSAASTPPLLRALPALAQPVLADAAKAATRTLVALSGSAQGVRRRLDQAGATSTVEHFRMEQVLWGLAGLGAGVLAALALAWHRADALVPGLVLVVLGGVLGVLARDQLLSVTARRRGARIVAELPTIAELLALSVAAGEGAGGALERVARSSSGELAAELRRTLSDAHAGATLVAALERLAARIDLRPITRFVDGVVIAVERGTPLAEVLRAQAQDAREASRRDLLEVGGRKEISMMVPVVFLVLPITVLFAVYPGFASLQMSP